MSKGMWTKHFSLEGKTFYYNAALQKSQWQPPLDAVVHEAVNAKPPPKIESEEEEEGQIKNADNSPIPQQMPVYPPQLAVPSYHPLPPGMLSAPGMMPIMNPNMMNPNMMNPNMMPFPPGMTMGMPPMPLPENFQSDSFFQQPVMLANSTENNNPVGPPPSTSTAAPGNNPNPLSEAEVQSRKNQQAALDIQARIDQALMQKQKEITGSKRFKKTAQNPEEDSQYSAYLKQKSDLENLSGSKGDDSSKWLVR